MKILLYNSFDFHHEMLGFMIEYCEINKYKCFVYCPHDSHRWLKGYKELGFNEFKEVDEVKPHEYDQIILLTDSDLKFHDNFVPDNLIVICHWYIKRYFLKHTNIPMSPFHGEKYDEEFVIPVFNIATKFNKHKSYFNNTINVVVLGENEKKNEDFDFITNKDVLFQFINRRPPPNITVSPKFHVFTNIHSIEMFQILANARYVLVTDCYEEKRECYKTSSSIAIAFSAGAQLIIPKAMNAYLRLKSAIIYDENTKLTLTHPDFDIVYKERDELMQKRNKILSKYICGAYKKIPAQIFQICILPFKCKNLPDFVEGRLRVRNPSYNYILYDDNTIAKFLKTQPQNVADKYYEYEKYTLPCHKKDFIEMLLLYEFGGVYFDIDQDPVMSFNEIISDADFVTCLPVDRASGITVGFIACTKKSPIMKHIISKYMIMNIQSNFYYNTMCVAAGEILKQFMTVDYLQEGTFYCSGQKIILGNETSLYGTHQSCLAKYMNDVWFHSRYQDYPWNLKDD